MQMADELTDGVSIDWEDHWELSHRSFQQEEEEREGTSKGDWKEAPNEVELKARDCVIPKAKWKKGTKEKEWPIVQMLLTDQLR